MIFDNILKNKHILTFEFSIENSICVECHIFIITIKDLY